MTESTAIWRSRRTNRRLYKIKKSNCSSCPHGFVSLFTGHTTTNQKSGIGRGLEMEDIDWILYFWRPRTRVFLRSIHTVLQTGSIGLPASSSMPPTHDHSMSAEIWYLHTDEDEKLILKMIWLKALIFKPIFSSSMYATTCGPWIASAPNPCITTRSWGSTIPCEMLPSAWQIPSGVGMFMVAGVALVFFPARHLD